MAVRGKGGALGKRVGFLDRETIAENRAIMREQQRRDDRDRPTRSRTPRYRSLLLEVAGRSRRDDIRSAAEVLAEHLADGESPAEATAAARRALEFVNREMSRSVERDWERAKDAVLAAWARTLGKGTKEAEAILAAIPERPKVDHTVRDALLAAGQQTTAWADVERAGRKLAEQLATGTRFAPAAARAWRILVDGLDEEARKEAGRKWAEVSRSMQTEWAKTHPEDAPAERPERAARPPRPARPERVAGKRPARPVRLDPAQQERLELLEVAAADVGSWPIIQPEGQHLIEALAVGKPFPEAARLAEAELEERKEHISEEEWALVRLEWGKILAVVARSSGALGELAAPA